MKMMKAIYLKLLLLLSVSAIVLDANAQLRQCYDRNTDPKDCVNVITTAVPLLRVSPDARSGGMGDAGIALSPDANSIYWNSSKLAFAEDQFGLSLTYTPWLRKLAKDIYLANLSTYYKINQDQALAFSIRYFSLGNIQFTSQTGEFLQDYKPNEFAIDGAYALKFSEKLAGGLNLKFVYSNLAGGFEAPGTGSQIKAGVGAAADINFYYQDDIKLGDRGGELAIGANISNVGSKISYQDANLVQDFVPINLGIGGRLSMDVDEFNQLTFLVDINKLMVPSPDTLDENNNDIGDHREKALITGMLGSFGDAPDGFSEEMRELMYSLGVEYWYNEQFAVRAGYYTEHRTKGNRKFLTVGLGLKYRVFGIDMSYLVPTSGNKNPLDNTLRFSLMFDIDQFDDGDSPSSAIY